jgi:hypothetical protein
VAVVLSTSDGPAALVDFSYILNAKGSADGRPASAEARTARWSPRQQQPSLGGQSNELRKLSGALAPPSLGLLI